MKEIDLPKRLPLKPNLSFSKDDLFPFVLCSVLIGTACFGWWCELVFGLLLAPFIVTRLVAGLHHQINHRRETKIYGHCLARGCCE